MDDLFAGPPKTLRNGRYALFEQIGSGGIATVYRAQDTVTEEEVAIKLFEAPLLEREDEVVSRFKAEGRAMSQLEHDRLVRVIDGAKEQGYYWFAMEYCSMGSLLQNVPQTGVDELTALDWTFQLIEGLGYIHLAGMVHRDIKPGNVCWTTKARSRSPTSGSRDTQRARWPSRPPRVQGSGRSDIAHRRCS